MKRKAAETKKEIQTHKKRKITNYCYSYSRKLVDELRQSFAQDLQTQQQLFGPLLKTTIFLRNDSPVMEYLPLFGREKMRKFYDALDLAQKNPTRYRPIAMVQSDWSGKVRLCIAAALDPNTNYYAVRCDFAVNKVYTSPFKRLCDLIARYTLPDTEKSPIDAVNRQRYIDWIVILFQIWVLSHVEWMLEIADEFKNQMHARKAVIATFYDVDAKNCVADILDEHWSKFSRLDLMSECEKYLYSCLKEVQQKIGKSRRPLIMFEHVTSMIERASIQEYTSKVAIPWKEVLVSALRRFSLFPNWQVCIVDNDREAFSMFEKANVVPFSELPKMKYKDMKMVLNSFFDVDLSAVEVDLKKRLKKLCGLPNYFSQLLADLFSILKDKKYKTSKEFLEKILLEGRANFYYFKDKKRHTLKKIDDKGRGYQFGYYGASTFFAQVYIATVLQGQDHIVIDDDNLLTVLVKSGVIMSNSTHGKQIIRKKDQPMVFKAVKRIVNSDRSRYNEIVSDEIIGQPPRVVSRVHSTTTRAKNIIKNIMSMKGRVTEHLLAWHLVRDSNESLMILLRDLASSWSHSPDEVHWRNHTRLKRVRVSSGSSDLITMLQNNDTSTLLLNHNNGIDACFLVNNNATDNIGVVVISFKPFKTDSFADAIQKVNPDYVLSPSEHAYLPLMSVKTVPHLPCEIEEEEQNEETSDIESEFDNSLDISKNYWYRIIYSTEPFPEDWVYRVNGFNLRNRNRSILFIEPNDRWMSRQAQEYLRANEPRPISFDALF